MPEWTELGLSPLSALIFGDGRPNSAGETDHAAGRFPPSPRTAQGLVRSALLRSVAGLHLGPRGDRGAIQALVGAPDALPAGWQVQGPWLACWKETEKGLEDVAPWLPLPRHWLRGRNGKYVAVQIVDRKDDLRWDRDSTKLVPLAPSDAEHRPGYLSPADLCAVLGGDAPRDPSDGLPCFVEEEPRTGLRIDPDRGTAEEGMLYTAGFRRLREGAGFFVRFSGDLDSRLDRDALTRGVSLLGGENRLARLLPVRSFEKDFERARSCEHLPDAPEEGERFWIWSTTPVHAPDPAAPLPRAHGAVRLEAVCAITGRPEPIGGFSLASASGHPSRRYLPSGSAWLVSVSGGSAAERRAVLESLHDHCVLGDGEAERAFGFGHALVAGDTSKRETP